MTLNEMQDHPVPSKTVLKQGYDSSNRIMYILFNHTGVYAYHDVPDKVYAKFLKAESAGKFIHKEIIPNHLAEKVTLSEN